MPEDAPTTTTPTEDPAASKVVDPYEFLAKFPGSPSKAQIDVFKKSACNGKVKLLTPDTAGQRVFILRGLSAREWEACQKEIPTNTPQERYEIEQQRVVSCRGTLWTNSGTGGKLIIDDLMNAGAGLTSALYEKICELSDFVSPQLLELLSVDL